MPSTTDLDATAASTARVDTVENEVAHLLELARLHLGMDVAFLGRFDGPDRTIDAVAADDEELAAVFRGSSAPRSETYCQLIADGTLGPVTPDTSAIERLVDLDVTRDARIGSYVGVPVVQADGAVWGTVCSYTHDAAPDLGAADAGTLRFIADLIAAKLTTMHEADDERGRATEDVEALLAAGEPAMVGQPIVDLSTGEVVGIEALARFSTGPPEEVFALATLGERSVELELAAVATAVDALHRLPDGTWMSCNVSLRTAADGRFLDAVARIDASRLVIEVTEHDRYDDEAAIASGLANHRRLGARIAMDDIGAGWSGLERALRLEPEILKLDRALITGVHEDPSKQALVTAIVAFAGSVGAIVVAEGIEQPAEHQVLRELGVPLGQGWLLGQPTPLS